MSNFMGVGNLWIGLNRAGLGCWRLTLKRIQKMEEIKGCQDLIFVRSLNTSFCCLAFDGSSNSI